MVLAGTSIGSGEWLFGPAVSAQYGGTLLWLATMSIVLQVFCNLMMMRYTLYCGEPIIVGGLRTAPGPKFWIVVYLLLDVASIWPYNASNAAVPLAAAVLGHLPGEGTIRIAGFLFTETPVGAGSGVYDLRAGFVPLIFGGTVYRMLEKIMSMKLIIVLGYLTFMAVFLVSPRVGWEVVTGFFRFGDYPQRADTIIVGRRLAPGAKGSPANHGHFAVTFRQGDHTYVVKGTDEPDGPIIGEFRVDGQKIPKPVPAQWQAKLKELTDEARSMIKPGEFFFETQTADGGFDFGQRQDRRRRLAGRFVQRPRTRRPVARLPTAGRSARSLSRQMASLVDLEGVERKSLFHYVRENGKLPQLDWLTLVAFAAIAGSGGLANTLFSNYTRDKGWGMGARVGAIPSAVGGLPISLSHVGEVFPVDAANMPRWKGWMRHMFRDQTCVWMAASFIGMALPCMLSLQFIRNATVAGDRVAAMTAEGIADR